MLSIIDNKFAPKSIKFFLVIALIAIAPLKAFAHNGAPIYPMVFPVLGTSSYTDTFGAPRSGGRTHKGADIFGKKGQALIAAAPGEVVYKSYGELGGYMLSIRDNDGHAHFYAHLNNDNPGTDDGKGGEKTAYAAGIEIGSVVKAGQVVAYLGDSGNAESTPPHLHYEIRPAGAGAVCPNYSLDNAKRVSSVLSNFTYSKPSITKIATNPFSPNGDFYTDKAKFTFDLTNKANVTFRILNYKGAVASLAYAAPRNSGANLMIWNGKGLSGSVLADGTYLYEIIAKAANGLTSSIVGKITVNKTMLPPGANPPQVNELKAQPSPFSPAGNNDLPTTTTISYSLSTDSIVGIKLYNYQGEVKTIQKPRYRLSGKRSVLYNGTNNSGSILPPGNYRLEVSAKNAKGSIVQKKTLAIR